MKSASSANVGDLAGSRRAVVGGGEAEHLAAHDRVLRAAEVGVEAEAELEQRGDAAADAEAALGRLRGAGEDLEQRALAGAVGADDADRLAGGDLEADVAQHPALDS